jgi:hypothetical protein
MRFLAVTVPMAGVAIYDGWLYLRTFDVRDSRVGYSAGW